MYNDDQTIKIYILLYLHHINYCYFFILNTCVTFVRYVCKCLLYIIKNKIKYIKNTILLKVNIIKLDKILIMNVELLYTIYAINYYLMIYKLHSV